MTARPESICALGAELGEGPVWIRRERALWCVDIKGRRLHRFDPAANTLRSWTAPAQPGWVLPARDGGMIAGLQTGLHRFDPATGSFALLHAPEPALPSNRLNDATIDPAGRLWFGSMDDREILPDGRLYRFGGGIAHDSGLPPVIITNGPTFAPDGATLYHSDTLGRRIWAVPVEGDQLGTPRPFVEIAAGDGYPDGTTVDAEGCVWTGLFGGWSARRYAPDGRLVATVAFPVSNVTKLAFGGDGLRTAYATTARKGLDAAALRAQPLAGNLFAFDAGVAGLPAAEAIID